MTEAQVRAVNRTARSAGCVGPKALVTQWVLQNVPPTARVLDYGAGRKAIHTVRLRAVGYDCVAYDIGGNVVSGLHDPDALTARLYYDVVMVSNVLNVLPTRHALISALGDIRNVLAPQGLAVINWPSVPRKPDLTTSQLLTYIRYHLGMPKRVGGTPEAPLLIVCPT